MSTFKSKRNGFNGEPAGSRSCLLYRTRGREKLPGTEGVKSNRGTEAAPTIAVCADPVPSGQTVGREEWAESMV